MAPSAKVDTLIGIGNHGRLNIRPGGGSEIDPLIALVAWRAVFLAYIFLYPFCDGFFVSNPGQEEDHTRTAKRLAVLGTALQVAMLALRHVCRNGTRELVKNNLQLDYTDIKRDAEVHLHHSWGMYTGIYNRLL